MKLFIRTIRYNSRTANMNLGYNSNSNVLIVLISSYWINMVRL